MQIPYDETTNTLLKSLIYDSEGNLISTPNYIEVEDDLWNSLASKYSVDDFCIIDGKISITKDKLIEECNKIASDVIYEAYPVYAQQNLNNDCTYSINIIAVELGLSTEVIYGKVYQFLGSDTSHDTLLTMKNNISTVDLASLVKDVTVDIKGITYAYRTILYSTLSYKLMKFVRDWCNDKKRGINACNTADELNAITFNDYPTLL